MASHFDLPNLEPGRVLVTPRCVLLAPGPAMAAAVAEFERLNAEHLARWNPPFPQGVEKGFWEKQLAVDIQEISDRRSLHLFAFTKPFDLEQPHSSKLVGFVNLNKVQWGAVIRDRWRLRCLRRRKARA